MLPGIVFENLKNDESLGKDVHYAIRMNKTMVYPPNKLRPLYSMQQQEIFQTLVVSNLFRYWMPGPGTEYYHLNYSTYEGFGFTYIQDMVDRGIVNILTNKTVTEPGGYLQRFPYPCYISDRCVYT